MRAESSLDRAPDTHTSGQDSDQVTALRFGKVTAAVWREVMGRRPHERTKVVGVCFSVG